MLLLYVQQNKPRDELVNKQTMNERKSKQISFNTDKITPILTKTQEFGVTTDKLIHLFLVL